MEEKKGFFRRLVSGLTKTRDNIVSGWMWERLLTNLRRDSPLYL